MSNKPTLSDRLAPEAEILAFRTKGPVSRVPGLAIQQGCPADRSSDLWCDNSPASTFSGVHSVNDSHQCLSHGQPAITGTFNSRSISSISPATTQISPTPARISVLWARR